MKKKNDTENVKKNKFNRNDAFSINMADPNSDEKDPIQDLIELQGRLFAFSGKSIFELLPAETIDPSNQEPDTRHSYQKVYSIGAENSFVARTIIQAKEILDTLILRDELDKQIIIDHVWDCSKLLFLCEISHHSIYSQTMKLMHKCDAIVSQGKRGSHISSLPQVKNLAQHVVTFLGDAKRFLEKSHELLCIFYGAPKRGANFEKYRNWMASNESSKAEVVDLLEQDKDWIRLIAWSRNALDINHSKPQFKIEIENFKIQAGNKFSIPRWKYDFSGKEGEVQNDFSDIIKDMDIHLSNMLTFFEELFVLCVRDNWDHRMNFEISKRKEENVDKKCPTLYFVSCNKLKNNLLQRSAKNRNC